MGREARANGNGLGPRRIGTQMPQSANQVPILGQPFRIKEIRLTAVAMGTCPCTTDNPDLTLEGDEPVRCLVCGKGYRAILNLTQQGPQIGILVVPPAAADPDVPAIVETTGD